MLPNENPLQLRCHIMKFSKLRSHYDVVQLLYFNVGGSDKKTSLVNAPRLSLVHPSTLSFTTPAVQVLLSNAYCVINLHLNHNCYIINHYDFFLFRIGFTFATNETNHAKSWKIAQLWNNGFGFTVIMLLSWHDISKCRSVVQKEGYITAIPYSTYLAHSAVKKLMRGQPHLSAKPEALD